MDERRGRAGHGKRKLETRTCVKSMLIVITMKKSERLVVANLSSVFLFGWFCFLFKVVTNVDIQSIEPVDLHMSESLSKSVQMAIEISTK